jgi:hypothetical protein
MIATSTVLGHPFKSEHAAPDGAWVGFWSAASINMALLTELDESRVPLKRGKCRLSARQPRPSVGTLRVLADRPATQTRVKASSARLSLGQITVFTYSNLVHSPAENGLLRQGRLLSYIDAVGTGAKEPQRL